MSELINNRCETSIGILEAEEESEVYVPVICWNIAIESYISDSDSPYRSYGCIVKIQSRDQVSVKKFKVFIKENDFYKFDKVHLAIVAQTHGELIMNSRFDQSLWSDLVRKLIFDSRMTIKHQQPARNIGLQRQYLKKMSFEYGGVPQLKHAEIVYNVVYNGLGELLDSPVNVLVPEAFPHKNFRVSHFKPSGLRGFLQLCLPPYTATSKFRRDQQSLLVIGHCWSIR